MIRTTPSRRTILHFSQRFLTDACTFIDLPEAVGDPAPAEVIGRQFDKDSISRENADEVHPDLARRVGEHFVPVSQFYTKHRVGQIFLNGALHLDIVFLCHSGPGPSPPSHGTLPEESILREREVLRQREDLCRALGYCQGVLKMG